MRFLRLTAFPLLAALTLIAANRSPSVANANDDAAIVARLDEAYQAAVKVNDVAGMDSILAPEFMLVVGRGAVFTKKDLITSARAKDTKYEHQEDTQRTVRLFGPNTAVATALLWEKGVQGGKPFDKRLWFSDVYVRTPKGWRYVFGQASLPLSTN
ncbi:MAG: nuclear transport factor 2 family protein [bacterium]